MMAGNRPKKNRSNRGKRAQDRDAARMLRKYPLLAFPPPFKTYENWFNVPDVAGEWFEYPSPPGQLSDDAKQMMDTLIKLGPRYRNKVPEAALYLDQQVTAGIIPLAVPGDPESVNPLPVAQLAGELSDPEHWRQIREQFPDFDGSAEDPTANWADTMGLHMHELHSHGALVLDDNHRVHLARPPQTFRDRWLLHGYDLDPEGQG
ncbi:hypothetical protein [Nocardia sp. 852002-51101_SCH5132738]|uniref:hypothetical protein n=1 Tax=Nocardia sp. 852002-51101_SCH5132738 TaxID=1834095 RepID=UPI0012E9B452|nr:hypothetical protein [Nocardia sp. 852002-51101_SCH5132738]